MLDILLATHNSAKVEEYRELLAGLPYRLVTLAEVGITLKAAETGASFQENAVAKARAYRAMSPLPTLAEDSGLEVDALGGEPGVFSARYAGDGAGDADRIRFLLERMKDIPWDKRKARFRCVIALAWMESQLDVFGGECKGVIAFEPRGQFGFGYDPVFYLPDFGKTMAELPLEAKNRISHRAIAFGKARESLGKRAREEVLQ